MAPHQVDKTVTIENARIIFRNFAGVEGQYNRAGDRNFCVLLDEDVAKMLDKDGWNIKALRGREDGDPDQPYIMVTVSFKGKPPLITMITSKGRTLLGESEIEILDWADLKTVDLILRPYNWNVADKTGVKAYLKTLFVTINEDELELKYANMKDDEIPSRSGRVDEGEL
jgi:hypothetical protein